ncbi:hypothetical protein GCM10008018_45310 [Paenibacillus marchantiophytorum]|uniref:DUF1798 family protein n=1 Tax=Paenibacillus marchantiophytorum TaxID=1619310 RepID=A0ABQ1EZU8_9BACL|nr:hypothetical protein [Paenibacillus marchantiophytorum]GFZ93813.1 hypothetical protein GCM10008018_45310 [Paenibacillus marchantiophytorum]
MEELIEEVEHIVYVYKLNIERQKKYYDYPFTNNPAHYYQLMMLQKTLEVWTSCLEKIMKNKKDRWGPVEPRRSKEFDKRIKLEKNGVPGFVTPNTLNAMLTHMKCLESRIEQLESTFCMK